jgi:hypothetical protein
LHTVPCSLQFWLANATHTPVAHNLNSCVHKQRCVLCATLCNVSRLHNTVAQQ